MLAAAAAKRSEPKKEKEKRKRKALNYSNLKDHLNLPSTEPSLTHAPQNQYYNGEVALRKRKEKVGERKRAREGGERERNDMKFERGQKKA